jgi:hypothetical protein
MEFGTLFADGDHRWLPWTRDITDTTHFELYCRAHRDIFLLIFSREEAQRRIKVLNSAVLPVTPRTTFFLPLRYYGEEFYDKFQDSIPDAYGREYVMAAEYLDFTTASQLKINVHVPLRNEHLIFNGYLVDAYGCLQTLRSDNVLVDAAFAADFPFVLPKARKHPPRSK